jgi:cytoskeleton protein RodZ
LELRETSMKECPPQHTFFQLILSKPPNIALAWQQRREGLGEETRRMAFGERLKREREQRGITLDDISLSTKIGTRLLRALEEDKFEQLPGGIFNKGFVRAYARHLGIDEEQAISDYLAELNQHQAVLAPADAAQNKADGAKPSARRARADHESESGALAALFASGRPMESAAQVPWNLIAGVLLLVALALAGWSYLHREQRAETPKPAPPVSMEAAPTPSAAPQPSAQPSSVETGSPLRPPITEQAGLKQPVTVASPASQQSASTSAGAFTVVLQAQDEDCWLQISPDGQPAAEDMLIAPAKRTLQAKSSLVIKAGNLGALDIFFNGKRLPAQGEPAEVRTLTFHPDGLLPPPPKPPLTAQ